VKSRQAPAGPATRNKYSMDIFNQYIPNFFFILIRAGLMVSFLPFLNSMNIPVKVKIGFAVAIALILAPVVEFKVEKAAIPLVVAREIMFGAVLGFSARLVFLAVDVAGQLMSAATGMSMAAIFNPEIGMSTDIAQVYGAVAMLIFLTLDAHHDLITIFIQSYQWLPAGHIDVQHLVAPFISMGAKMFTIALKMSAPVVVIMLVTNILLGFVYKAAPQINIFFVAYPIYIAVGLLMMFLSVPIFTSVVGNYMTVIKDDLLRTIAAARM
jgi:flagellar biosynthesis protein FliR